MDLKSLSLGAVLVLVACVLWLYFTHAIFGTGPVTIAIQILAALLMLWARITFGTRSFHATANPTAGGLVTTGPYRLMRHPIYAAILAFVWAGVAAHPSSLNMAAGLVASIASFLRMIAEERLLIATYPEYREYSEKTRRVIPFLL